MRRPFLAVALLLVAVTATADPRRRAAEKTPPPLDAQTLAGLSLARGGLDLRPGSTARLQLYVLKCCVYAETVQADVRFSVDPQSWATVDPATGVVTVAADAPGGIAFRVYADVEHGRRIVSADVYVDTLASNPLRGGWRQVAEIACGTGVETPVARPIAEFIMRGNHGFEVTWVPFEIYHDYWGLYTFDTASKRVTYGVLSGNYVPPGVRGEGTYEITDNGDGTRTLRLKNIWLGSQDRAQTPACGMVFRGDNW